MHTIPGYDAWKLATPYDDLPDVGIEVGDSCDRHQEPDEDAPRGWKCTGTMIEEEGDVFCDICHAIVNE